MLFEFNFMIIFLRTSTFFLLCFYFSQHYFVINKNVNLTEWKEMNKHTTICASAVIRCSVKTRQLLRKELICGAKFKLNTVKNLYKLSINRLNYSCQLYHCHCDYNIWICKSITINIMASLKRDNNKYRWYFISWRI